MARDLLLKSQPDAQVSLKKSGGGVFEINVDGQLAYSKKATGDFPTDRQVLDCLS